MYDDDYGRRGGSVFGAFLLGGIVGAVLGLLFSPRSGKENREMIASRAQDYMDQGREAYDVGRERVSDVYSTGRETAAAKSEEFRVKIDEARNRLKEQVNTAGQSAREAVSKMTSKTEEAIDMGADTGQEKLEIAQEKAEEGGTQA